MRDRELYYYYLLEERGTKITSRPTKTTPRTIESGGDNGHLDLG